MPWSATGPMEQRQEFIRRWSEREGSVVELCEQFEISRKTAYKWIGRHEELGRKGLAEQQPAADKSRRCGTKGPGAGP